MRIGRLELNLLPHNSKRSQRLTEFGGQGTAIEYVSDLIIQLEALQGNATNRYITRLSQVQETIRKYRGQAAKGNILCRNILETRAAFTVGRGLSIRGWNEGTPERAFVDTFLQRNRLGMAYLRRLARERCFEGQILLTLNRSSDNVPAVRYISWVDTNYEIQSSMTDYATIESIRWDGRDRAPVGQAAFMAFHNRLNSHEGTPLFAGVLDKLETLDDNLAQLGTVNRSAANPTPYWEFPIEADSDAFRQYLKDSKWKMGDPLAGAGKPSFLQLGSGSYSSIETQIMLLVKILSGHTGVPPHYFGFSELLNNRAVADDIKLMYVAVSDTEIDQWSQGLTDLIGRAMAMFNQATGSTLNTQPGTIFIEQISEEAFRQVLAVWLPVWLGGGISTETLLTKLPGLDETVEAEKVRDELLKRAGQTPGELMPPERRSAFQQFRAFGQTAQ